MDESHIQDQANNPEPLQNKNNPSVNENLKLKKVMVIIQIIILLVGIFWTSLAVMTSLMKPGDLVGNYLKNKYGLDKSQYSLLNNEEALGNTYYFVDNNGNKFKVTKWGPASSPYFIDNYQQHQFEQDVLKILSKYIDLKIAHIDTDYNLSILPQGQKYNSDPVVYIKAPYQFVDEEKSYPIRLWVSANDSNSLDVMKEIKNNIIAMSDALGCGIKIYVVKDTVNDYSNLDYIWNEKGLQLSNVEYSRNSFYYIALYNKSGENNFIINADTNEKENFQGDNL